MTAPGSSPSELSTQAPVPTAPGTQNTADRGRSSCAHQPFSRLRALVTAGLLIGVGLGAAAGMDLFGLGLAFTLMAVLVGAMGEARLRHLVERTLPAITPTVFIVVGLTGDLLKAGPGGQAFYAAAAQVLPVLIVGLTIEAGIFANHTHRFSDTRVSLLSMFLLGIGEVAALRALARGHGGREEFVTVIASISAAFAGLAAAAVVDRRRQQHNS